MKPDIEVTRTEELQTQQMQEKAPVSDTDTEAHQNHQAPNPPRICLHTVSLSTY